MTSIRVSVVLMIGFLVLTPFLGFAAGDVAHIWDKHPRHTAGPHSGGPQPVWKPTPGTLVGTPVPTVVSLIGWLVVEPPLVATLATARPPFVPPRV
jgi:hypothetical protein